ncbi:hypothetical protein [Paraburkholderia fungorum]|uniref:Helix-turn-helix domain-containing protein n=1 Tax=Paraburkholderia fungorum TaxID=134537 RepID=A0AAW3V522_9BURK|nr:hypothetical protein [Paraburkholderia fungorum]MBB4517188.1 hypothetical protein [Paraburkholderia fungorum]MBB6204256.1 hypothetical protein [Paraburkholderia fungorum]
MTEKEGHLSPQMVAMLIHIGNGNASRWRREWRERGGDPAIFD